MNNIILWSFQILLAIWFGFGAYKKLSTPIEKMMNNKALPFGASPGLIIILGFLEFLGAIGILVSQFFCPMLTAIIACCFGLIMCGATVVHLKNKTYKIIPPILIALVLSVLVAYHRF